MAQVAYPNATTSWITYGNKAKGFLALPTSGSPPYPAVVNSRPLIRMQTPWRNVIPS